MLFVCHISSRDEMESAKSKFRVVVNVWAMIGCVATASWLIYFARSDKVSSKSRILPHSGRLLELVLLVKVVRWLELERA